MPQSFFDEKEFLTEVYSQNFSTKIPEDVQNYESFMRIYKDNINNKIENFNEKEPVILLLDEAQLYPENLIEKIRLMADTRLFKILFTVHKTN